jgi:hypothetical protein
MVRVFPRGAQFLAEPLALRGRRVLRALYGIGWMPKRQTNGCGDETLRHMSTPTSLREVD